ncbi:MAG: hypothetical protein ACXWNC_05465, partial [Anaerolineales bacterium]
MPHSLHRLPVIIFLGLILLLLFTSCGQPSTPSVTNTIELTSTPTIPPATNDDKTQTPYVITATPEVPETVLKTPGVFYLSFEEGGYYHLFAYSPQSISLTRLTANSWDDITPALSPNGNLLAFSSRRNGYWDLYLLELGTGIISKLTNTIEYDAAPTWSPDGAWIAYESYTNGGLNIGVRSVIDKSQAPLPLTKDESSNTSPAWSPLGRQIAFVSNRSGEPEIWVADLDRAGTFTDISNDPMAIDSHPTWSPDGRKLAWASTNSDSGLTGIYVWDSGTPGAQPIWIGAGDWPVWLDDHDIATRLSAPNQNFLTGYSTSGTINIPPMLLPGQVAGLSVGTTTTDLPGPYKAAAQVTQPALFDPGTISQSDQPSSRLALIPIPSVTAAFPKMIESAADSFQRLRTVISTQAGWDALGNLENAFIPLTTPPDPGLGDDWLYTGRAFTLNPVLVQAGWMVVVREDFGQQVYWRIFLRTAAQDGSQGMPLTQIPWDFSARATSSSAYENGGQIMSTIPAGYWLDLTTLSAQYGW